MVTMTFTEWAGQVFRRQLGIPDDKSVCGLAELANLGFIKAGAKTILQISHGGNLCSEPIIGAIPVGPSDIPQWPGQTVHALTTAETEAIIENYGKATARAKEAGLTELNFTPATVLGPAVPFATTKCRAHGQICDAHHFPLRNRGCHEALTGGRISSSAYA